MPCPNLIYIYIYTYVRAYARTYAHAVDREQYSQTNPRKRGQFLHANAFAFCALDLKLSGCTIHPVSHIPLSLIHPISHTLNISYTQSLIHTISHTHNLSYTQSLIHTISHTFILSYVQYRIHHLPYVSTVICSVFNTLFLPPTPPLQI